jgi:ATP-binding cassette subfamily F protein 3
MDMVGKETLENMLKEYTGTVVFVTHDRYFVNKVADKMLIFRNGSSEFFPYGYSEFELKEKEREQTEELSEKGGANLTLPKLEKRVEQSQTGKKSFSTPLKDKSRKEKRVKKLEQLISDCESELSLLNSQLEKPEIYSDYVKVNEIQGKIESITKEHENYSEEWLMLSEELENM